jgi:hypothetical protein
MKVRKQRRMNSAVSFTADEHLWVQMEIEKRAHELWRTGGCPPMASLNYWLQAEREMLEKLLPTLFQRAESRGALSNTTHFTEEVLGAVGKNAKKAESHQPNHTKTEQSTTGSRRNRHFKQELAR